MSKLEVNAIDSVGTTLTLGDTNATTLALNSSITTLPSALKNTPAFFATLSSNQSVPSGTNTKIQFDNEVYDTDNCYDNTTNYRFTPNVAGKYYVFAFGEFAGLGDTYTRFYFYKNGSEHRYFHHVAMHNFTNTGTSGGSIVDCNGTTDYVEMYAFHGIGSNCNFSGTHRTYFGAYKLIGV